MDEILTLLVGRCSFLYKDRGCRFSDSKVFESFGGDAWLTLSTNYLRLKFVRDRGQIFLDFQRVSDKGDKFCYSIDIVRQFVTGEKGCSSELNPGNVDFLKTRFAEIEELFSSKDFLKIRNQLDELKRLRSKDLFG